MGLFACSNENEPAPAAPATTTDTGVQDSIPAQQPTDATATDTATVMLTVADKAALSLYDEYVNVFAKENKSTIISPLSIRVALTMLANGTVGQRQHLLHTAGWEESDMDKVNLAAQQNIRTLMEADETAKVAIANNIWYKPTFTMNAGFTNTLGKYYEVQPASVERENVVEAVNSWCDEKTNGQIKEIIKEVSEDYRMILANALYFKSPWTYVFNEKMTTDMPFTTAEGVEVTKPFMRQMHNNLYARNEDYAMIELGLGKRGRFLMDVILPNEGKSIAASLESIKENGILEPKLKNVDLALPKFTIESNEGIATILEKLTGMKLSDIELSLISEDAPALSEIKHAARLTTDETGVEGAAATAIMGVGALPGEKIDNARFYAVRPFCVLIKERTTGEILFIGQVCE